MIVLLEKTKERERGGTAVSVAQSIKSRKEQLMMITIVSIILRTISVESSKSLFEYERAIIWLTIFFASNSELSCCIDYSICSYSIKILEVDSAARARTRMSISILLQIERASTILPVSGHLCPRGTRGWYERGYRISIYATPIIFQIAPLSFTLRPSDSRAETHRALSLSLSIGSSFSFSLPGFPFNPPAVLLVLSRLVSSGLASSSPLVPNSPSACRSIRGAWLLTRNEVI